MTCGSSRPLRSSISTALSIIEESEPPGTFADDVELALQLVLGHAWRTAEEDLFNVGLRGPCQPSDGVGGDRRVTPAEDIEYFFLGDAFDDSLAAQAGVGFDGEKDHSNAVLAGLRKRKAELGAFLLEELVRNLDGDAGTVAGLRIAAAGPAMGKIDEDLNALLNDVVARHTLKAGNEAHSTGVALEGRIVEALRRW
jgi:hypothetical protein